MKMLIIGTLTGTLLLLACIGIPFGLKNAMWAIIGYLVVILPIEVARGWLKKRRRKKLRRL